MNSLIDLTHPLFIEIQTLDSTNNWLKTYGKNFHSPIGLRALVQTKGRGRGLHEWKQNPYQDLAMSLGFKVKIEHAQKLPQLPLFVAVVIAEAIEEFGIGLNVKWPNDLFFNEAKLGGILCESLWQGHDGYFIIGLGLNVKGNFDDYSSEFKACSLEQISNSKFTPSDLWQILAKQLFKRIPQFLDMGISPWLPFLNDRLAFKNRVLDFEWSDGHSSQIFNGKILQVEESGELSVQKSNGEVQRFSFGELRLKAL